MSDLRAPSLHRVTVALAVVVLLALGVPAVLAQVGNSNGLDAGADGPQPMPIGDFLTDLTLTEGLVLGAVVTTVALLVSLFFMGGTKYVTPDNVLENDTRRLIYEHLQEHPGTHLRAVAQDLELSTTNVLWHLRKLQDATLVNSKKMNGYKLFYPTAEGVEGKRKAVAAAVLKNQNAQDILEYVLANPSAHQREIARALDVNHGTIRWHLRKLLDAGLVEQVKKEHTTQYYISPFGNEALAEAQGVAPTTAAGEAAQAGS